MSSSEATLLMLALFLFRLALPLIVTLTFGFIMNRLANYWIGDIEL